MTTPRLLASVVLDEINVMVSRQQVCCANICNSGVIILTMMCYNKSVYSVTA